MTGRDLYEACCRYLLENRWHRDGDDAGIWLNPYVAWREPETFGDALTVQLDMDGVSLLEEATL